MRATRYFAWYLALAAGLMMVAACATDQPLRKERAATARELGEGYLGQGDISGALREFLRAEKLYRHDPFLYYDLGLAYLAKEQFESAIESFKKAISLRSDYAEAYNALGTVYLRLKAWDEAIESFNKATSNLLYATPYIALNNLGDAYRGKEDFGTAIEFYKKALDDNPRFPNAHRGLGLVFMALGDYKAAVSSLEKAVDYAPRFSLAWFDLGRAYTIQHQKKKAIGAFERVVMTDPESRLAARAREEITRLRATETGR